MVTAPKYQESAFQNSFDEIRNSFRKYWPATIVASALKYLAHPTKDRMDELQKHPWLVVLLIKWVLVDTESDFLQKTDIWDKEFQDLLQAMHDLAAPPMMRMPSEYENVRLWFRNIAYQQFMYQVSFNAASFGRQIILFDKLPLNHT